MFNRSFISVLIVTSAFTLVFGQTPEAKKDGEKARQQTFTWSFDGDGGYLGVQTQEVTKENFAKLGLRAVRGVAIEKVIENSPAAVAGIQSGDVIVRFNGEEIASGGGSEQEITVTLGKHPFPKFENGNFAFAMPEAFNKLDLEKFNNLPQLKDLPDLKNMPEFRFKDFPDFKNIPKGEMPKAFTFPEGDGQSFLWRAGEGRQIGIAVYPVTKQLGERYGVESGVMINNVRENSAAAKAGLKAGDIIVEVNGKAVKGEIDLIRAINGKKEGDVTVTFVRDRNRQTISVTPEVSKDGGFFFQTDDEDVLPPTPRPMPMTRPTMPATPMPAPAPMSLFRPCRIV